MPEKLTIDFGHPVPLFPLSQCVLFPNATVPLHVFEQRYKRMVGDVLDSHGLVAMALFEGNDWKRDYNGSPPVRPTVCVGYVVRHECLPDGRCNILLQGICRAAIKRELDHTPYRTALLQPTEPNPPMEIDLGDHRRRIESILADPLLKQLASVSAIHNWFNAEIPTTALIDLAIMTICCNNEHRYAMLAEPDVFVRAVWLEEMLQDTRCTLVTAERFRQEAPADGVYLN